MIAWSTGVGIPIYQDYIVYMIPDGSEASRTYGSPYTLTWILGPGSLMPY